MTILKEKDIRRTLDVKSFADSLFSADVKTGKFNIRVFLNQWLEDGAKAQTAGTVIGISVDHDNAGMVYDLLLKIV